MSTDKQILKNLIDLYEGQITQLTVLSKIELGDDVIDEINKLKSQLIDDQWCHYSGMPSPNAYVKDKDDEQSIIDYNKMEEESEMDNYNKMKDER